jgi:3-oxoadipate enol-lactonase
MTERRTQGTRGATASAGAIELTYDATGEGTPVLLLHGFPHDRTLWVPQLRGLGRECRIVAPDLRGFGASAAAPPYTIDQYADDAVALLDTLGIERAVVGGLSMGGYIAFALWRRHRTRVRALVLASTRAAVDSEEARRRRHELIALARASGAEAVADAMVPGSLGKRTRARDPELVAAVRAMMARAPVEGIVGALEAMLTRADSVPTLATIDVPTLVIAGDDDAVIPVREARAMHEGIAGSRFEVIPGAGHLCNLERPAAFNAVLGELVGALTE